MNRYAGMSAVGDVSSHPETTTKCSRTDVNVVPKNKSSGSDHDGTHKRAAAAKIFLGVGSVSIQQSSLSNQAKTTSSQCTNLDANKGTFIPITAVSINFFLMLMKTHPVTPDQLLKVVLLGPLYTFPAAANVARHFRVNVCPSPTSHGSATQDGTSVQSVL